MIDGDENSLVDNTGDVIGDCELSVPLGSRGLTILRGDEGAGILRAGD
jgi:hypothetical protein